MRYTAYSRNVRGGKETISEKTLREENLPAFSGAVIACNILNDRLGIALPVYFFGSGTCCSLGGMCCCSMLFKSKNNQKQVLMKLSLM